VRIPDLVIDPWYRVTVALPQARTYAAFTESVG
jgi:hypothetical protein